MPTWVERACHRAKKKLVKNRSSKPWWHRNSTVIEEIRYSLYFDTELGENMVFTSMYNGYGIPIRSAVGALIPFLYCWLYHQEAIIPCSCTLQVFWIEWIFWGSTIWSLSFPSRCVLYLNVLWNSERLYILFWSFRSSTTVTCIYQTTTQGKYHVEIDGDWVLRTHRPPPKKGMTLSQ